MAQRISFTASESLRQRIGDAADREGVKIAQYVREAVIARLATDEDGQNFRDLEARVTRLEDRVGD